MPTLDCKSHSCVFSVEQSGRRNNGPCLCLRDDVPAGLLSVIRMTVHAKVQQERERCAKTAEDQARESDELLLADEAAAERQVAERIRKGK